MKTINPSVDNINYHPKSTSTVDFAINSSSSIKDDINFVVYKNNVESIYKQQKENANKRVNLTAGSSGALIAV